MAKPDNLGVRHAWQRVAGSGMGGGNSHPMACRWRADVPSSGLVRDHRRVTMISKNQSRYVEVVIGYDAPGPVINGLLTVRPLYWGAGTVG